MLSFFARTRHFKSLSAKSVWRFRRPGCETLESRRLLAAVKSFGPFEDLSRVELTDQWVVQLDDVSSVAEVAAALGTEAESWRVVEHIERGFLVEAADLEARFSNVDGIDSAFRLIEREANKRLIPNDPLFGDQWHLNNTGQLSGIPGEDANLTGVWDSITGSGVTIGVVDDGVEHTHADLLANYNAAASFDFNDNDADPTPGVALDDHGTSVAGVAAGVFNNNIGISGAAPDASIAGLRLLGAGFSDLDTANALSHSAQVIDVYNNSWGPTDDALRLEGPGPLTQAALANGVANGRGGLGSIYVWAAGNGLQDNDNVNYDGFANSRYTVAVTGINNQGQQSFYAEPGAPILVSAHSNLPGITTTTTGGGYTNSFGGTSSATPLAAGVIALMLEANPNLTWRDVQHVLVNSARVNDAGDGDWTTNGAGRMVNHKYGFGAVDAGNAVATAQSWTNVGPEISASSGTLNVGTPIPDNDPTGVSATFNVTTPISIESVEVNFNATHTYRGDLEVVLTSPSGTQSVLAELHNDFNQDYSDWTFSSVRHWGESSVGTWTLTVRDQFAADVGTFDDWSLDIFGTSPTVPLVVNSTGDGGDSNVGDGVCDAGAGVCTLRAAIEEANGTPGTDTIHFDIPGPGPHTIMPGSALPLVTDPVILDAMSEPDYAGSPVVELSGVATPSGTDGIRILSGGAGSSIFGLAINQFPNDGVEIVNSDGNTLDANHIGTDVSGTQARANASYGVRITNSSQTQIGTGAYGNVISGNGRTGVLMTGATSSNNTIDNNRLGTDVTGTTALANGSFGAQVIGGSNNTFSNNVISGNQRTGLVINGATATNNTVRLNYVGVDPTGAFAIPNGSYGVLVQSPGNTIGGEPVVDSNIISGNGLTGVVISGTQADNNLVRGNLIGTDMTGLSAIGNGSFGLNIIQGEGNLAYENVISGNLKSGVVISGSNATNNSIRTSLIGVDLTGAAALPNGSQGVQLKAGANNNTIGGVDETEGNVISGNVRNGVVVDGPTTTNNIVDANVIGLNREETAALGNGQNGVLIRAPGNLIGDVHGNVISANGQRGVLLSGINATNNLIFFNSIGTDYLVGPDFGNVGAGIQTVQGADGNGIVGNFVLFNAVGAAIPNGNLRNTIVSNTFDNNDALGIDLGPTGVTPNDVLDADEIGNRGQNSPVISNTQLIGDNLNLTLNVDSDPNNATYPLSVEVFVSLDGEEGAFPLGGTTFEQADFNAGSKSFVIDLAGIGLVVDQIVATATDSDGNTSEFSALAIVGGGVPASARGPESDRLTRQAKAIVFERLNSVTGLRAVTDRERLLDRLEFWDWLEK